MPFMKIVSSLLLGGLAIVPTLPAAPFDPAQVAEDAKWFAHVDFDGLKASATGRYAIDQLKMAVARRAEGRASIDWDRILQQVHSVTAYGAGLDGIPEDQSVILIQTSPKAQAMIDGVLAGQELAHEGKVPFKTVQGKRFPTYLFANDVYMTYPRRDLIVISRQFDHVERALRVLNGRRGSLTERNPLMASVGRESFLVVASANGLHTLKDVPPQARWLQKATGLQLALGERGKDLAARVTLHTEDPESAIQMRRLLEGVLAMATLVQVQGQDFSRLVENVSVNESDCALTIGLRYPAEEVIKLVESLITERVTERPGRTPEPRVSESVGGMRLWLCRADAPGAL